MKDIILLEFNSNLIIGKHRAIVFDNSCNYNMILGQDFIQDLGVIINYNTKEVTWRNKMLPLINNILSSMHYLFLDQEGGYFST